MQWWGSDCLYKGCGFLISSALFQGGWAPLATSEGLDGTHPPDTTGPVTFLVPSHRMFQAVVPLPVTAEEPDWPQPHEPGTNLHVTLSSGAAGHGIGGSTDEFRSTYSIYNDPDLASSEVSIASYKTERTVNSRKSRYNALARRKHADSGDLGVTEGIASLNVDDASVQGGEIPTAGPPPGPSLDQRMTGRAQEGKSQSSFNAEALDRS
ncbi:hypothetical protein EDB83DRAFT_2316334 [Lactarius deliciosus]|nr:hypothetical protein EDB83DRAFT_2316334 [Lactarius deliciosus]